MTVEDLKKYVEEKYEDVTWGDLGDGVLELEQSGFATNVTIMKDRVVFFDEDPRKKTCTLEEEEEIKKYLDFAITDSLPFPPTLIVGFSGISGEVIEKIRGELQEKYGDNIYLMS